MITPPGGYSIDMLEAASLTQAQAEGIRDDLLKYEKCESVSLEDTVDDVIEELEELVAGSVFLTHAARKALTKYLWEFWGDAPNKAKREGRRIQNSFLQFATAPVDGVEVKFPDWPHAVRLIYLHPFLTFYESNHAGMFVIRLYHHTRKSKEP